MLENIGHSENADTHFTLTNWERNKIQPNIVIFNQRKLTIFTHPHKSSKKSKNHQISTRTVQSHQHSGRLWSLVLCPRKSLQLSLPFASCEEYKRNQIRYKRRLTTTRDKGKIYGTTYQTTRKYSKNISQNQKQHIEKGTEQKY